MSLNDILLTIIVKYINPLTINFFPGMHYSVKNACSKQKSPTYPQIIH